MTSQRPEDSILDESGARNLIGYEIDLTGEEGNSCVRLQVECKHLNRNGSLHGGITAMLLDSAAGFAASRSFAPDGSVRVVTVSLNTQYLAPGREGLIVATGVPAGGGRSITYADAELRHEDGQLIARATGVFKRVGKMPD